MPEGRSAYRSISLILPRAVRGTCERRPCVPSRSGPSQLTVERQERPNRRPPKAGLDDWITRLPDVQPQTARPAAMGSMPVGLKLGQPRMPV